MTGASLRPTIITVSRKKLADNVSIIARRLNGRARLMAVVKADAYGHGIIEQSRIALRNGADTLAVALVDEGMRLRDARITSNTLVLGGAATPDAVEAAIANHMSLALYDANTLKLMDRYAQKYDTVAHAHLKIDTGMHRVGLFGMSELDDMLERLKSFPRVKCEGVFTHFATADSDAEFMSRQNELFKQAVSRVRSEGYRVIAHAAASASMLRDEATWHDMVRVGIALYGAAVRDLEPGLLPAQKLACRPVRIHRIATGESVSYGRTFTAQRDSVIATLPIGYGDGYPRALSNKAQALVKGVRVNVIGRVCMDMIMVDVTDVEGVTMKDEFVLMGEQMGESITPDELAEKAGTIPYEIMLGFKNRVPRIYVD